jgi:hypothetical protein
MWLLQKKLKNAYKIIYIGSLSPAEKRNTDTSHTTPNPLPDTTSLSLAFPSSPHGSLCPQRSTYFPHIHGRRLISQATMGLPRC